MHFRKMHFRKMHFRKCTAQVPGPLEAPPLAALEAEPARRRGVQEEAPRTVPRRSCAERYL